jgi:hypothetical protein
VLAPDGSLLLAAGQNEAPRIVFAHAGKMGEFTLPDVFSNARSYAFSADSQCILVHAQDQKVFVWDLYQQKLGSHFMELGLEGHVATACCFFGPNYDVALGTAEGRVFLLPGPGSAMRPGHVSLLQQHPAGINLLLGRGQEPELMSADLSGQVRLTRMDAHGPLTRSLTHPARVTAAAFSPCHAYLATGDAEGRVCLTALQQGFSIPWSKTGAELPTSLSTAELHHVEHAVAQVTFSSNSRWLGISYRGRDYSLCDLAAADSSTAFAPYSHSIGAEVAPYVLFSSDSSYVFIHGVDEAGFMLPLPQTGVEHASFVTTPSGSVHYAVAAQQHEVLALCDSEGLWQFTRFSFSYQAGRQAVRDALGLG